MDTEWTKTEIEKRCDDTRLSFTSFVSEDESRDWEDWLFSREEPCDDEENRPINSIMLGHSAEEAIETLVWLRHEIIDIVKQIRNAESRPQGRLRCYPHTW